MEEILTFNIEEHNAWNIIKDYETNNKPKPKVAVLRTEWSNSQDEIQRFYKRVWFEVYDIHLNDLISWKHSLDDFPVIDLVWGFSHWDALWAGVGWAQIILNNPKLREQFENYKWIVRGSCNWFQTICELAKWLETWWDWPELKHNKSNSFEARKWLVKIVESKDTVFLKWMGGSIIESISSHWEWNQIWWDSETGIKFVDNNWNITEQYPYNPNGSENWNTSFEYRDDKKAIFWLMPHPERDYRENSPWLQMALNIREEVEKYI